MRVTDILFAARTYKRLSAATSVATRQLEKYAVYNPIPLTLDNFIEFGARKPSATQSFIFMRKELPVRLANIMKEFNALPEQLMSMPSVQLVESWYEQSFREILLFERENPNDVDVRERFIEVLDQIRKRHRDVVQTMAQGMVEMTEEYGSDQSDVVGTQVQYFLDRFYMSRIGIRMLINQHILLFGETAESSKSLSDQTSTGTRHIGSIDQACDIESVAKDAYDRARFLCEQYYLRSPEAEFIALNPYEDAEKILITYVPSHLYHMLFELYKNSMRATVEHHDEDDDLPKISTMICKSHHDLTVKISDQGGGIPKTQTELLFNYMYSTAPRPPSPDSASIAPLAGYGYGLPLSRLYAKYFLGDLQLSSVDGYGTDAHVYMKVNPRESTELLPFYNFTSAKRYDRTNPVGDWSDCTQTGGLHGAVHQVPHRHYSTARTSEKVARNTSSSPSKIAGNNVRTNCSNDEGTSVDM